MIDAAAREKVELVAIGASAGALSAILALLPFLEADFGPTVAVVVHLPPRGPSLLSSVLSPHSALPVCEIEDKQPLTPGAVFLAPAGYHVLVEADRRFTLNADDPVNFSRPSIDVLFESASVVLGDRVLGIVLTGANYDGAAGLRAIRRAGGLAIVQDPAEAAVPVMPRAAISAAPPHAVLQLAAIGDVLRSLPRRGSRS